MATSAKPFFVLLLASLPLVAAGQECRADSLLRLLRDGGASGRVMIFAHRGNWRNSAENSMRAFAECIDARLDGVEVDVRATKDGALVVMHDETIDRTTTGAGNVADLTLDELRQFNLRNPIGARTRQKVPTFEEVLLLCKGKILIQVDKWQPHAAQIAELARRHDCERQIVLRTTETSEAIRKRYGDLLDNMILMPVLVCTGGAADEEKFEDFTRNFTSGVFSISFPHDDCPTLEKIPSLKKAGFRIWMNSLWETMNAGHDDELAATDPVGSYGWLIDRGADIIFSDNPMLLKKYLHGIGRR